MDGTGTSNGGKTSLAATTVEERSKNVNDLMQVLMDINKINGGNNDTAEKMKLHAKNFEAALFAKSSSRKEYMDNMREKVNAMRNTLDLRKKEVASTDSQAKVGANNKLQQQQYMSHNSNMNMNMNMNSQMFLNQQAQLRQQAAQQLRNQQQQQQQQQQQRQQHQGAQLTPQQQQIINQMKVATIPRELLQRMPNIPQGVNTWQQITELAQQRRLTPQDMQVAKEIYKIHQQLLFKSKPQQQQQHFNNANNNANLGNVSMANNGTANMNMHEMPNVLGQINQIFTPDEQRALLQEAMEACKKLRQSQPENSIPMTDATRQSFIRKYINQKALRKIQSIRLQAQLNNNNSGNNNSNNSSSNSNNGSTNNNNTNNTNSYSANLINTDTNTNMNTNSNKGNENSSAFRQQRSSVMPGFAPTQQDIEVVKRISAEAAKTPLKLTDLTNSLTLQEREDIKRKLQVHQQLFAQVSNYAPQIYILTKSEKFLKEVLQLRLFVKEILEKCSKGVYVVKAEIVDKLIMKYQTYWESMKLQLLRRQQLLQQKQLQQQQKNIGQHNASAAQGSLQQMQQKQQQMLLQQQQQQQMLLQQQQMTQALNSNNDNNVTNNILNHSQMANNQAMPTANGMFVSSPATDSKSKSHFEYSASPDSNKVSPESKRRAASAKSRANAKKPSPTATTAINTASSIGTQSTLSSVQTANNSKNDTPNSNIGGYQRSPSPLTVNGISKAPSTLSISSQDHPFKKEELDLHDLSRRKAEVLSRFKHRQEIFGNSSVDLFLSTYADCLGLKDEKIELVATIPLNVVDNINGTGKRKIAKTVQRVRDQDVVAVRITDNRLIMESKAESVKRSYKIPAAAISAIFNSVYWAGDMNLSNLFSATPAGQIMDSSANISKKRKVEDLKASPSNSTSSPSSSLMSESKRIKIDSPDDMFISKTGSDLNTKAAIAQSEPVNVWDWGYWS